MKSHRHDMQSQVVHLALFCCVSVACIGAAGAVPTVKLPGLVDAPITVLLPEDRDAGAEIPMISNRQAASYADLSGLVGGQLYIGQGLSVDSLSAGVAPGLPYVVVAEGVGALDVAGAMLAGRAEPFMSSHSRLLQGTTPALGSLNDTDMSVVFLPTHTLHDGSSYTISISRKHGGEYYLAAQSFTQASTANGLTNCHATAPVLPVAGIRHVAPKPPATLTATQKHRSRKLQAATPHQSSPYLLQPAALRVRKAKPEYFHYAIYVMPQRSSRTWRAH